ncbi:hypothetical protein Tco_0463192 [Tanacetum coccineum]
MKPSKSNIDLTMKPKTNHSRVLLAVGASHTLQERATLACCFVPKAHLYYMLANESWQALLAAVAASSAREANSKRHAFWSLNEDILKNTILETNMSYPSKKIRRIRVCTHQRPLKDKDQYTISRETQYVVFKI